MNSVCLGKIMIKPTAAVREVECSMIGITAAGRIYSCFRIGIPPCRC
jgi:hypothetical protein